MGRTDGSPAVDYTINAGLGFPQITGPVDYKGVVNHALPAWDVICGLYAALAITAAVRRREVTGAGASIRLPLEDTALSISSALGYLTEPQINGSGRKGSGNDVYGTYGTDFVSSDGQRFMIVALTPRHFTDLIAVTGTGKAIAVLEGALNADFSREADRFVHRAVLNALFAQWFASNTAATVTSTLSSSSILFEQYKSFEEIVNSGSLATNPLFAEIHQPGIGHYLAAGHPARFDGQHYFTDAAPDLGAANHTAKR